MTEIADLTATQTLARIRAGSLTFEAVRDALAERIAAREPVVRAFADLCMGRSWA
jgi:Asp-tRNA(Asn)/Glu-tRNA(Gln) amidotransferase A subunit family amidase